MADNNDRLPTGEFLRIDSLWAWIACDEEGEGVLGHTLPDGRMAPLIGADLDRIESHRALAMAIGQAMNRTVRLVHFTTREELEMWPPAPAQKIA